MSMHVLEAGLNGWHDHRKGITSRSEHLWRVLNPMKVTSATVPASGVAIVLSL
jgi:hypothetical protein